MSAGVLHKKDESYIFSHESAFLFMVEVLSLLYALEIILGVTNWPYALGGIVVGGGGNNPVHFGDVEKYSFLVGIHLIRTRSNITTIAIIIHNVVIYRRIENISALNDKIRYDINFLKYIKIMRTLYIRLNDF